MPTIHLLLQAQTCPLLQNSTCKSLRLQILPHFYLFLHVYFAFCVLKLHINVNLQIGSNHGIGHGFFAYVCFIILFKFINLNSYNEAMYYWIVLVRCSLYQFILWAMQSKVEIVDEKRTKRFPIFYFPTTSHCQHLLYKVNDLSMAGKMVDLIEVYLLASVWCRSSSQENDR